LLQPHEHLRGIHRTPERHEGRDDFICLYRNERVSPIPEAAFRDMLAHVTVHDVMAYPDAGPFVSRLSRQLGLPEDHIAETAGSDAAMRRLFMAYLRPGGVVVTLDPAYAMYRLYTRIFQGVSRQVSYRADRQCDVPAFLDAIRPDTQIVMVAHPDQPIGTAMAISDIRAIVTKAAIVGAICLVDEAYHPFYPVSAAAMVTEFDNLLVTRSFSKYPGCAGLRLGYAIGQPHMIRSLMLVRGGNEVSGLSLAMGAYLLDHPEIAENFREGAERGRAMLLETAVPLGFESLPCVTNFHLLRCPPDIRPEAITAALEQRGYLVKCGFTHPSIAGCIRVSLNAPDILGRFLETFAAVVVDLRKAAACRPAGS
jgi:histidinol-phosphate aminotransferase